MNDLDKAIIIATKAHAGQVDKGDNPYILHPLTIMTRMKTNIERIVAVLHDVLEDTEITLDDLRKQGFDKDVLVPLQILTRNKKDSYESYINKISENDIARNVKIEDIKNNMDLSRIQNISEKDLKRNEKYKHSLDFLLNSHSKEKYK